MILPLPSYHALVYPYHSPIVYENDFLGKSRNARDLIDACENIRQLRRLH